ncbi:DUF2812 domain-containing protein [Oscillibacter sp.]|uniref:DUF2812 domain-containing protein n=1 Tax=Oscillibacter sp. TaxID=1945593 RepID=UPI00261B0FD3|nr:DUF2812 domain-containing protein [Oscillibacter sp.]MDD3346635.1 DUF2812 domain-containing protein [Oscillibacter sp.]
MRNTKREWIAFSFYDFAGIAAHLETMAARGWMLERIGALGWQYRRTEPAAVRFSVTYFAQASEFDPAPSENETVLQDYCAEAGWELVTRSAQMQIFCTHAQSAVPIETDAAVQLQNIHRAMKKNYLPGQVILLLLSLFQLGMQVQQFHSRPVDFFTAPTSLFLVPCWLVVLLLCSLELSSYFRWRRRAVDAAQRSRTLALPRSHYRLQRWALAVVGLGLGCWLWSLRSRREVLFAAASILWMALLIFLVNFLKSLLKRKRVSAAVNRAVTLGSCFLLSFVLMGAVVFGVVRLSRLGALDDHPPAETYEWHGMTWEVYHDALPLTVEDLMDTDYPGYSTVAEEAGTALMWRREYAQEHRLGDTGAPEVHYEIVETDLPALLDLALKEYLSKAERHSDPDAPNSWEGVPAEAWQAERAFRFQRGDTPENVYLVCWPDRLAQIRFNWEPTPAQMALAATRLKAA